MVVKSTFGSAVLIFIAPVLFFLFVNIGMLVMMITGKKALFHSGLQPGVYPLYGSVYLRWLCGSLLQKEGFKQNFWFLRRTKVLVKLFRLLGGKIRTNVILDSPELLEPDLINIQARSSVGEGAVISPAFITPEGCLGDVPCLVFSPVYIGAACDVGLAASIHGGGNLPSDQSLKPYGCLNQSHAVIDSEQMRQKFPHFYPEEHLSDPLVYAAMCIQLLVAYLCVFPGTAACVLVCGIFDSSVPSSVRSSIIGLPCLVILYNLIIKIIVARLTARTVNYSVLKFKQLFLGKLNPGRNLVQDRMSCWLYCIFLKLIYLPFYDYYATAIPLGLTVGKHTGIKDGVREHDAVSIGSYGTSGGVTFFRCVKGNGEIGGISIESHVSCGNCAFFPGAVVQVGAQIGNETPIGANSVIGRFSQVQGDHETRSEQSNDMDFDQSKEPAVAYAVSVGLAIQKELPWEAAKTVAIDLPILSFIHSAYCLSPLLVAPACIVGTFIHSICSAIWLRTRLQYIGYYDLIQAGKSLGNTLSDHVTYQQGSLGIFKLNENLHYLVGTPWFNLFLNRLLHVKVSDKAIILTYMMPEWHLIEIGRCLLERYSIASTHSIRKGQYIFDNVEILDNAWVGCKCRLLCPKLIGQQSRVLPGSLVFPGESVHQGEVWAGVPAHCIKSNKSE
jgi:carbonic anhydrase/acetyltransferase-like protein (isoleucine patch superfamily)